MPRILSCFTNSYGPSGVWTAVEQIKEAGIDHLELALRGHNFGGLVIPESAVITEKADDATARSFVDHLARHGVESQRLQRRRCRHPHGGRRRADRAADPVRGALVRRQGLRHRRGPAGRRRREQTGRRLTSAGWATRPRKSGITLALETHKGPTQNAAAMLALMSEVDHPHVRLNFDTGNIAYYNHGVDPCDELEKVKHLVRNVHLKDNRGGFEDWYFPAVGDGGARRLRPGARDPRLRGFRGSLHDRDRRHRRRARAGAGREAGADCQKREASEGVRLP